MQKIDFNWICNWFELWYGIVLITSPLLGLSGRWWKKKKKKVYFSSFVSLLNWYLISLLSSLMWLFILMGLFIKIFSFFFIFIDSSQFSSSSSFSWPPVTSSSFNFLYIAKMLPLSTFLILLKCWVHFSYFRFCIAFLV